MVCVVFFTHTVIAQKNYREYDFFDKSVVIYRTHNNKKQKESLEKVHKNLTSLGVDVVNYLDSINLFVSNEVTKNLLSYFKERDIKNIIYYSEKEKALLFGYTKNENELNKTEVEFFGDSIFKNLKKTILEKKKQQQNFLFSPNVEVISKINIK